MDNISLTPNVRNFLQNQVAAGIYKSLSDAINAYIGIIIIQEAATRQQKEMMNAEIRKGLEDVNSGRVQDGIEFMNDLIAKYEET